MIPWLANGHMGSWGGQNVDEDLLPVRRSTERLAAWKYANIVRLLDGSLSFQGVSIRVPYRAEDDAVCAKFTGVMARPDNLEEHDAPGLNCSCGFYGVKDVHGTYAPPKTPFLLEVEFSGRVVVCEHGYRAARIRVLSVRALRCCAANVNAAPIISCAGDGRVVFSRPDDAQRPGVILCGYHADKRPADHRRYTLADLAGQLGTEVTWRKFEQAA